MLSWALGIAYAAADWLLLRRIMKKAVQQPQRAGKLVAWGLAGRYLLTAAVLAVALLLPGLEPLGVVAAHRLEVHVDPQLRQPLGDHGGVGVHRLAQQQFRPHRYDLTFHG